MLRSKSLSSKSLDPSSAGTRSMSLEGSKRKFTAVLDQKSVYNSSKRAKSWSLSLNLVFEDASCLSEEPNACHRVTIISNERTQMSPPKTPSPQQLPTKRTQPPALSARKSTRDILCNAVPSLLSHHRCVEGNVLKKTSPAVLAQTRLAYLIDTEKRIRINDNLEEGITPLQNYKGILGLSRSIRGSMNILILEMEPDPTVCYTLYDHLRSCDATRHLALLMFNRYFSRVLISPSSAAKQKGKGLSFQDDKYLKKVYSKVYKIAIGCMSLGAKFNGDFNSPLIPFRVDGFLSMSRRALTKDQLRETEFDIMDTLDFDYHLPVPEEYLSLIQESSLEAEISHCFKKAGVGATEGWRMVERDFRDKLGPLLLAVDSTRFPIYILAPSLLIDSIQLMICEYLLNEPSMYLRYKNVRLLCFQESKALVDLKLLGGTCSAFGIDEDDIEECRIWLSSIVTSQNAGNCVGGSVRI